MSRWRHASTTHGAGNEESLPQCIEHLCAIHLKKNISRQTTYSKPKVSLQQYLRPLKRAAFIALFDRQQKNCDAFPGELLLSGHWNEKTIMSAVAFRMRTTQRRFFDADRLEELTVKLLDENEEYSQILRLLLHLSNVDNYSPKQFDVSKRRKAPTRDEIKKIAKIKGSLYAGDYPYQFLNSSYTLFLPWHSSRIDIDQPIMYPEMPKDAEQDLLHAKRYSPPNLSVFKNCKGLFGLQSEIFADKGLTDLPYEIDSQTRLYGGLKHSRTFDLDIKLSYPAMTGPVDMMASIASSVTSVDEGFVSPSSSIDFSESEAELPSKKPEERRCTAPLPYYDYRNPEHDLNLWRDCLTIERSSHRTWETLGLPAGSTQRRLYLTEAGSKVFDEVWQQRLKIVHNLTNFLHEGYVPLPRWTEVTQDKLVKDTVLVAMGVASETFQLNKLAQMLIPRKNIYLSGVDPESVHSLLSRFSEWGTCYWRLLHFSAATPQQFCRPVRFFQLQSEQEEVLSDVEKKGAIFKAFADAIRRYLHEYQHRILSMNVEGLTLQNLALKLNKAGRQIRYLCELCHCGEPDLPPPLSDASKKFPTGVALLSYLYEEAIHCPDPNHNLALLYLLRKSCLPYLQFVQDWVFRGNCWDASGEFMLRVNADYGGARRDRQRWLKYVEPLHPTNPGSCVPSFLSSVAGDVYMCGKTVSLMQFICPEHFLVVDGIDTPELEVTFSKRKFRRSENNWKRHDLKMIQFESERTIHWIEKEKEIKATAHKVARMVRKAAHEETVKIQEAMKQERMERHRQKMGELERLKKQAEEEMERKAMAIRKEKEEDLRREEDRRQRELKKEEEKNRIFQEERKKIVSYYEELNNEAEKRILKADWMKRRNRLQTERMNFNAKDKVFWWRELKKYPFAFEELAAGDKPANEGPICTDSEMEMPATEDVFELPAQPASSVPDMLQEFVENAISVQSEEKRPAAQSETLVTDMEKALSAIDAKEYFFGSSTENQSSSPHVVPGTCHVSHETSDLQGAQKTQIKMVAGKSATGAQVVMGHEPFSSTQTRSGFETRASNSSVGNTFLDKGSSYMERASVGAVVGKNVSDSNIGDLLGLGASPQTTNEYEKHSGRKRVHGQHVSATTFTSQDLMMPSRIKIVRGTNASDSQVGALMTCSETVDIVPKTFKKLVPGRGVSASTVASLMSSTEVGASLEFIPKAFEPDSVMGEILYGSPVFSPEAGCEEAPPAEHLGLTKGRTVGLPEPSHPSNSTIQSLLYGSLEGEVTPSQKRMNQGRSDSDSRVDVSKLVVGEDPLPNKDIDKLRRFAMANSSHGAHHSQSSLQSLLYYDSTNPWNFDKKAESKFDVWRSATLRPSINSAKRHPSYSTLQLLLYPKPVLKEIEKQEPKPMEETFHLQLPSVSGYSGSVQSKLEDKASDTGRDIAVDLIGTIRGKSMENEFEDESSSHDWRSDIDTVDMHILPMLLTQCIVRPIMQQVALVNRCVINYFMVDMELLRHFEMLRHFCFMEDGEFGQVLTTQLFEKMHSGCRPIDLLNPVALRSLIMQAVQGSATRNSPHSSKLTFSIQQLPHAFSTNDPSSLDCFTLKYDIGWPCNIIVTETNQFKYGRVFGFLLKLKHIMWVLHDVVSKLSSMEMSSTLLSKFELRQLHLYRHEMQNFIKVMQGYVSTQVLHVCWHEFQDGLKSAKCLEDLHALHSEYLRKCIYRCLLTKKSSAVMNVITDVFKIILRFWTQLSSNSVSFVELRVTYANFRKYSDFLFKVVSKLVDHGYQPHLEDFLLRLNYNGYYDKCLSRDVRK